MVGQDPVASTSTGLPTMSQFIDLVQSVEDIKKMVAGKGKEGDESTDEEEANVLPDPAIEYQEKYERVLAALPIKGNRIFLNILNDPDGPRILQWILQLATNKAVAEEGATYDTTSNSSALASKVLHILFSVDEYVTRYKMFDPRENYQQQDGTCMDGKIYMWLKDALTSIAAEFYMNFQLESAFDWDTFFAKFRHVWRWTRSNNSETRRQRRRNKKKQAKK